MMRALPIILLPLLVLLACGSGASAELAEAPKGRARGEQLFNMHCTLCHGKDGKLGLNGAKDLTVSALSREEMVARVTHGKGRMMPYKNVLTPAEIDAVVAHVRSLRKNG